MGTGKRDAGAIVGWCGAWLWYGSNALLALIYADGTVGLCVVSEWGNGVTIRRAQLIGNFPLRVWHVAAGEGARRVWHAETLPMEEHGVTLEAAYEALARHVVAVYGSLVSADVVPRTVEFVMPHWGSVFAPDGYVLVQDNAHPHPSFAWEWDGYAGEVDMKREGQ